MDPSWGTPASPAGSLVCPRLPAWLQCSVSRSNGIKQQKYKNTCRPVFSLETQAHGGHSPLLLGSAPHVSSSVNCLSYRVNYLSAAKVHSPAHPPSFIKISQQSVNQADLFESREKASSTTCSQVDTTKSDPTTTCPTCRDCCEIRQHDFRLELSK